MTMTIITLTIAGLTFCGLANLAGKKIQAAHQRMNARHEETIGEMVYEMAVAREKDEDALEAYKEWRAENGR